MRVLLVHPGASWATYDLYAGLRAALIRAGVEVHEYALDGRIEKSNGMLDWLWKHRTDQAMPHPNHEDVLYAASKDITERALWHRCDWVLCVAVGWLHWMALEIAHRAGLKVGVIFTESPNEDERQISWAGHLDACWVNERTSVAKFRALNPHSYYWQHAIDPERHHTGATGEAAAHDVVFVGTGWIERCELLRAVDWAGIDFGLYGSWSMLGSRSKLRRYLRNGITPNELTAALYRNAKIGINLHRTSVLPSRDTAHNGEAAESMNPRCYELAAAGCFFVTDYRAEVGEVFGDAVPTFHTPQELQDLLRYWLAPEHDAERRERAAALPGLVAGHTFDERARGILEVLGNV